MNVLRQLEQGVLAEGREGTRQRLERLLQAESEFLEPLCPRSGQRLRDVRWRDLKWHTVIGPIPLRVRYGYSPALGRWICPARAQWGWDAYQRLSPQWEACLAYTASETGSCQSAVIYRLDQRAQTTGGRGLLVETFVLATPPEMAGPPRREAALSESVPVEVEPMRPGVAAPLSARSATRWSSTSAI